MNTQQPPNVYLFIPCILLNIFHPFLLPPQSGWLEVLLQMFIAAFFMRIGGRWCYIVPRWITSQWWYLIWSLLYNSQNVFRYVITMALSMAWWSRLKYCFQLRREELRFKGLWCPFNQIQAVKQIPTVNTLNSKPRPLPSQLFLIRRSVPCLCLLRLWIVGVGRKQPFLSKHRRFYCNSNKSRPSGDNDLITESVVSSYILIATFPMSGSCVSITAPLLCFFDTN